MSRLRHRASPKRRRERADRGNLQSNFTRSGVLTITERTLSPVNLAVPDTGCRTHLGFFLTASSALCILSSIFGLPALPKPAAAAAACPERVHPLAGPRKQGLPTGIRAAIKEFEDLFEAFVHSKHSHLQSTVLIEIVSRR